MHVLIIEDERGGSHVEPPLLQSWDELTKLSWKAGTVWAATGVRVHIMPGAMSEPVILGRFGPVVTRQDRFALRIGASSIAAFDYRSAWDYLNGVEAGAAAMRNELVGNA